MSEIVNLNRARKTKARSAAAARAAENRATFGLSKAQKAIAQKQRAKVVAMLDGHKRQD